MNESIHLQQLIQRDFQDLGAKTLYFDIFGKVTPENLQQHIYSLLEPIVGAMVCYFTAVSIGAVFGFVNKTGERFVFKVYSKRFSRQDLDMIHFCQKRFLQLGYPAPEILSDLIEVGPETYGILLSYINGENGDGHDPAVRQGLAYGLAEFSKIVDRERFPFLQNPFQSKSRNTLWPHPHKSTIRLKETSKGANFIKKRAVRARRKIFQHSLEPRLAHLDWGVKNALFRNQKLIAVFDWDSLGSMSEAEMVGQAAAQFTADWEIPTKITPSPSEAWSFLEDYQNYRGNRFTKMEMEVISAAADYVISLIARFEYAEKLESENSYLYLVRSLGDQSLIPI